jgi:hypothetical protein
MNLRCSFCQTPFTLGRVEKIAALQHMYAENLNHYDAHCPRCRRATPVQRQKLEMTMPNWREALKGLEAEMAAHPQQEAPPAKPQTAAPAPTAGSKPEQVPAEEKPAKEKPAKEKPAPQKPSAKGKPAAQSKASAKKTGTAKKAATKKSK